MGWGVKSGGKKPKREPSVCKTVGDGLGLKIRGCYDINMLTVE